MDFHFTAVIHFAEVRELDDRMTGHGSLPRAEAAAEGTAEGRSARGARAAGHGGRVDADDDDVAFLQAFQYFGVSAVTNADFDGNGLQNGLFAVGAGAFLHDVDGADGRSVARRAAGGVGAGELGAHGGPFFGRRTLHAWLPI